MNNTGKQDQLDWWLGLADMLASGTDHGVKKLERVHLAIANESFTVLNTIPVTRPWAKLVKQSHDGITGVCYGAVKLSAQSLGSVVASVSEKSKTL